MLISIKFFTKYLWLNMIHIIVKNILLIIFIRYFIIMLRFINSPLLGALFLILISILIRLLIRHLIRKWIRFLVILLFLGGIIVLFVYISTLISRIKRFLNNSYNNLLRGCVLRVLRFIYLTIFHYNILYDCNDIFLSIIYFKSNFCLIRICVIYLLLVLVMRIKISQKFKGRIKSKMQI